MNLLNKLYLKSTSLFIMPILSICIHSLGVHANEQEVKKGFDRQTFVALDTYLNNPNKGSNATFPGLEIVRSGFGEIAQLGPNQMQRTLDPNLLPKANSVHDENIGRQKVTKVYEEFVLFNPQTKEEFKLKVNKQKLKNNHERQTRMGTPLGNPMGGGRMLDGVIPDQSEIDNLSKKVGWSNGVDTRSLKTPTTAWPWRTITHFSNNCSGTLIGPRHIITAAHCVYNRNSGTWSNFTAYPARDGNNKPYGGSSMSPNPAPGDPFRWYFVPSGYMDLSLTDYQAVQWDWALIIIPDRLGDQTGWMGYVARPGNDLKSVTNYNRGYPLCGTVNEPENCQDFRLYGDGSCGIGNFMYKGPDNWNRVISVSCDISGGHSGSPIYHYFYDNYLNKTVPVVSMVVSWELCYTCNANSNYPNLTRRLTPSDLETISFFRAWKP